MDLKETQTDDDVPKKGPFDQLDRDELIKKCKGLLLIAKNAKQAKNDFVEENAKQKDNIQKLEIQKEADKNSLRTMQNKRLTDENEELINDMETLEKKSNNNRVIDVGKYENLKFENERLLETVKSNEELDHSKKITTELEKSNEMKERLASELATLEEQNNVLTQHSRRQAKTLQIENNRIFRQIETAQTEQRSSRQNCC